MMKLIVLSITMLLTSLFLTPATAQNQQPPQPCVPFVNISNGNIVILEAGELNSGVKSFFLGERSPAQLTAANSIKMKLNESCSEATIGKASEGVRIFRLHKARRFRVVRDMGEVVVPKFNSEELVIPVDFKPGEYLLQLPILKGFFLFSMKK